MWGKKLIQKIKDDYVNFEEFISHWIAGYCYNAVFDSTCPDCTEALIAAIDTARAYIPFESLAFTGKNADKNHTMTLSECVYTPSALASKMIPMQKVYKRYWNDDPDKSVLEDMIKEEENYPEISDLVVLPHLVLMCTFSSAAERVLSAAVSIFNASATTSVSALRPQEGAIIAAAAMISISRFIFPYIL